MPALEKLRRENNELKLSLERKTQTLTNCTTQDRNEIATAMDKKNEEMFWSTVLYTRTR